MPIHSNGQKHSLSKSTVAKAFMKLPFWKPAFFPFVIHVIRIYTVKKP